MLYILLLYFTLYIMGKPAYLLGYLSVSVFPLACNLPEGQGSHECSPWNVQCPAHTRKVCRLTGVLPESGGLRRN